MTVLGYTYISKEYCNNCINSAMTSQGLEDRPSHLNDNIEHWLDLLAEKMKIDRTDEKTFDCKDFPKIITELDETRCDDCFKMLSYVAYNFDSKKYNFDRTSESLGTCEYEEECGTPCNNSAYNTVGTGICELLTCDTHIAEMAWNYDN